MATLTQTRPSPLTGYLRRAASKRIAMLVWRYERTRDAQYVSSGARLTQATMLLDIARRIDRLVTRWPMAV